MKNGDSTYTFYLKALPAVLLILVSCLGMAQDKKERLRIRAVYTKIMEGPVYLDLSTSARIDRANVNIPNIDLHIYYEVDGEEFPLGKVRTGPGGDTRFTLDNLGKIQADSTGLYILGVSFDGNDAFRRASRSLEFRNASIQATLQQKDSLNYIAATLTDVALDSLVEDALIRVQVKRMFNPLRISEDLLMTDAAGSILVPVPGDIPGRNGVLEIEIMIEDNDTYGTVKKSLQAQVGTTIVEESTYDQRSLWGTANKAPLFILFFTGILVFGSWGLILYLLFNLYKIAKNKL
jgi:hypothetical protein